MRVEPATDSAGGEYTVPGIGHLQIGAASYVDILGERLIPTRYRGVQDLAFMSSEDEPIAWFAGGAGLAGGRLILAPAREYRLRASRNPFHRDWQLREGRAVIATLTPMKRMKQGLTVNDGEAPSYAPDQPLLYAISAYVLLARTVERAIHAEGSGGF